MSARAVVVVRGSAVAAAALALAGLLAAGASFAKPGERAATPPTPPTPAAAQVVRADTVAIAAPATAAFDPWHEARELANAGRYDTALVVVRSALSQRGDDFSLRWLEAGVTAEAGRHRESVALYEKLSANYPDRAADLLADLAAERLWASDPAGAAKDYRRWLRTRPDDRAARRRLALSLAQSDSLRPALAEYDWLHLWEPADNELALERARVLAWMGRNADAIAAYRAVLARDSASATARLGVAMNENWAGRHRVATRHLEAIVRDRGADPEAIKALAFARYWDANPAGARSALDVYLRLVPGDTEGRQLSRRLARERASSLRFEGGRADDSDALRILTSGMELSWPIEAATTALLRWRRDNLRDAGGTQDPLRLTAGLRRPLGAAWSVHGELTHTDWGASTGAALGGDFGLVSRPVDGLRLDAGVSREPVLTRRSLASGISLLGYVGAADLKLANALMLHVVGRAGHYSDHNRSERAAASLRWQVLRRGGAELALSMAAEQLHTDFDAGHGYYAPSLHREWGPGAEAQWQPLAQWTLVATSHLGWQHDAGGDTTPFYALGGRSEIVIGGACTLELEGGTSDSSLQTAAGYQRKWWQAALTLGF